MTATGGERWTSYVNAIVTVVVPLEDVAAGDPAHEKAGAAQMLLDDLTSTLGRGWDDASFAVEWEDIPTTAEGLPS